MEIGRRLLHHPELNPLLDGIQHVHKTFDVVAVGDAGLLFPHPTTSWTDLAVPNTVWL